MALERANIKAEWDILITNNLPPVFWKYKAEFIIEGLSYFFTEIKSITTTRDYKDEYAESKYIRATIPITTYRKLLFKKKRNVKVKLTREQHRSDGINVKAPQSKTRMYVAYFKDIVDQTLMNNTKDQTSDGRKDLDGTVDVVLKLQEEVVQDMRLTAAVSGVYYGTSKCNLLKTLMSYERAEEELKEALLEPEFRRVRGVEIHPCTDSSTHDWLMVPTGLRIVDFPQWLQFNEGVYASGIGYFFQEGWWHIYPLHDYTRFTPDKKTLTVALFPQDEVPVVERTYMYRSEQLWCIATGEKMAVDLSEYTHHNYGNAYEFFKSSELLDSMFDTPDNEVKTDLDSTLRKFKLKERKDGKNNIIHPDRYFTDNPAKVTSKLIQNIGRHIVVNWDNADPELLFPGMPTKILYIENDETKSLFGTLLKADIVDSPVTESMQDTDFRTNIVMTIFIEPEE